MMEVVTHGRAPVNETLFHRRIRTAFHQLVAIAAAAMLLAACSGPALKKEIQRDPPSYHKPPAEAGLLAEISMAITDDHGAAYSGFKLLDESRDALWPLIR